MSLNLLHVATHEGVYRGGAVQLCRMAAAQIRRGHKVSVIAFEAPGKSAPAREMDRASWKPVIEAGADVLFMNYRRLWGTLRLRRAIIALRPDVLHAHRNDALHAAWLALWGLARPALVAQRGTISVAPKSVAKAFASPRTRAVVAVSEAVKSSLIQNGTCAADKIGVVYGGVDLDEFAPGPPNMDLRCSLGIPDGAPVIGSLSAYRRAKGLETLLAALKIAFASHPTAHAVFLGENVPEKLSPLARELGVADRVHLLGHRANVRDWLSIMDLTVVSATSREGLSGVLRESLAMEIPVISTDCAGNAEIVRDGETGVIAPMNDPNLLARAIEWSLDQASEMKAMARKGRQWVASHCAPEIQAERLDEVYRAALGGATGVSVRPPSAQRAPSHEMIEDRRCAPSAK